MWNTFFARRLHLLFLIFGILFFLASWRLGLSFFLFYFFLLFIFRRKILAIQSEAPVAPVFGKVTHVSGPEISFKLSFLRGYGIYMPFDGLIIQREKNFFIFKDKYHFDWKVEYRGFFSLLSAHIFILPGDWGKKGGNVGFLPWGGTLRLYLPKNYEILLKKGDRVFAGQMRLAKRNTL